MFNEYGLEFPVLEEDQDKILGWLCKRLSLNQFDWLQRDALIVYLPDENDKIMFRLRFAGRDGVKITENQALLDGDELSLQTEEEWITEYCRCCEFDDGFIMSLWFYDAEVRNRFRDDLLSGAII
jgi:hypothetical protein